MTSDATIGLYGLNPEELLALCLSAPAEGAGGPAEAARLPPSKRTIYEATILLQILKADEGASYEPILALAREVGHDFVRMEADFRRDPASGYIPMFPGETQLSTHFLQRIGRSFGRLPLFEAQEKTDTALHRLEVGGLAFDPAFVPGLVVLAGLVPMQFSIRTPEGERIYKKVTVQAPAWSLCVELGKDGGGKKFTDIDFHFRGVQQVRHIIGVLAASYLVAQEGARRDSGLGAAPTPRKLEF